MRVRTLALGGAAAALAVTAAVTTAAAQAAAPTETTRPTAVDPPVLSVDNVMPHLQKMMEFAKASKTEIGATNRTMCCWCSCDEGLAAVSGFVSFR